MEDKIKIEVPSHCVEFTERETVERYVTALYRPGAYDPNYGDEASCLACGFKFNGLAGGILRDTLVYLPASARFCPICGSRFERKAHIAGLYPEEDGKAEWDGIEGKRLQTRFIFPEEDCGLIGDGLYAQLREKSTEF